MKKIKISDRCWIPKADGQYFGFSGFCWKYLPNCFKLCQDNSCIKRYNVTITEFSWAFFIVSAFFIAVQGVNIESKDGLNSDRISSSSFFLSIGHGENEMSDYLTKVLHALGHRRRDKLTGLLSQFYLQHCHFWLTIGSHQTIIPCWKMEISWISRLMYIAQWKSRVECAWNYL